MTPLQLEDARPLGFGRGYAALEPANSIRRIDEQLGRPADVNEAWRSPQDADANYARWIAYLNGGPIAPYALPGDKSVHCAGEAADSDDWYDPYAAAVWRHNGWRQTARYPGSTKDEPWHGEYFKHLDLNYFNPVPADVSSEDFITKGDIMAGPRYIRNTESGTGVVLDVASGPYYVRSADEAQVAADLHDGIDLSPGWFDHAVQLCVNMHDQYLSEARRSPTE